MKRTFIKTENYTKMFELMSILEVDLAHNPERMGLCYGWWGVGKTFALERLAKEFNALLFRQVQTWTVPSVLHMIAKELEIDTSKKKSAAIFDEVVDILSFEPRPIIIDEIDGILGADRFKIMEFFRDIHDMAGTTVVFVGMESCNARLKNHGHFYSRIVESAQLKAISKGDVKKFFDQCEVGIKDDLIEYFYNKYPNPRLINKYILRIEKFADINGYESMDVKQFIQSGIENRKKEQGQ